MKTIQTEVLVIGSGAAGMCAAAVAKQQGLDVLLIEKTDKIGGTTALSGGAIWVPLSEQAKALGIEDDLPTVERYLDEVIGQTPARALRRQFLQQGAEMLAFLAQHTAVKFNGRAYSPDYLPERPGAAQGGRALDPVEFDGSELGQHFALLRAPWPEFLVFGGMMVNRTDIHLLLQAFKTRAGFKQAAKLVLRYGWDRLRGYTRGTRLLMGNALAGRLYKTLLDLHVPIWRKASAQQLLQQAGRVTGALVHYQGELCEVQAKRGVLLASGGFAGDLALRQQHLPAPTGLWSAGNAANTGDGLRMALQVGAQLAEGNVENAFYSPVSLWQRPDGSIAKFPHLMLDRYKPGVIMVSQAGLRFVNEADSYHACGAAQYRAGGVPAWLICDRDFLYRYGLGLVRPQTKHWQSWLDQGYLLQANTLAELAVAAGIQPDGLVETIRLYNQHAKLGQDPAFGKGGNSYNTYLGDPEHQPNPCLAPIVQAPFFAVQVVPGDIGTAKGLQTDHLARVLDAEQQPIPGLYAAGNDMNSIMEGHYPGPGITLGPGLTFGYIAARHMATEETEV